MTLDTQVIVGYSFSHLLSLHKIDTFHTVPVSEEEKQIIHVIQFLINKFYTDFDQRIREEIDILKERYEKFTDCLSDIFLHSFPCGIDWSHIVAYMIFVVEATVCYIKKNSAENTLEFAWSTLWANFEKYLNVWIEEQGGWPILAKITSNILL